MATASAAEFRELEKLYARHPAVYRGRVLGLIVLGYLFILVAILLIAGFVVAGILLFATRTLSLIWAVKFIQIGFPAVAVAAVLSRSVFVRVPRPEGIYLDGRQKARVLNYFEDVRNTVGGKKVDDVVVTNEFNAAVQQLPRLGIVGPTRNFLLLGAPLLELMTPREVRAVVAHEFGHLSHKHGRMGALVYRLDQTLIRATSYFEINAKSGLFGISFKLLAGFYRRFSALTFPMRRGQEYEADAVAAKATSAETIATALCRLNAFYQELDRFWSGIWRKPYLQPDNDAVQPYASMRATIAGRSRASRARVAVRQALQVQTDYSDSHPALGDRLKALGQSPVTEFDTSRSAFAEILAAGDREALLQVLDEEWRQETADVWRHVRDDYRRAEEKRKDLQARREALGVDELLELATLEEALDNENAARAIYESLVADYPDDARAQFHWGRINAESDFDLAEPALLKSAALNLELAGDAGLLLEIGYEEVGRPSDFDAFKPTLVRFEELCSAAADERSAISPQDEFVLPELDEAIRDALRDHLRDYRDLDALFLVEKPVRYFRSSPVYLLGYVFVKDIDGDMQPGLRAMQISQDLCSFFPFLGNPFWVIASEEREWLERLRMIDGAGLYARARQPALTPPETPPADEPVGEKILVKAIVLIMAAFFTFITLRLFF